MERKKERRKKKRNLETRDVFLPLCSNKVVSIIQKGKEKNSTAVCGNLSARWRKQMVMRRQWTKQKRTVTVLLRSTPNMRMHRQDHLPSPPLSPHATRPTARVSSINHIQIQFVGLRKPTGKFTWLYCTRSALTLLPFLPRLRYEKSDQARRDRWQLPFSIYIDIFITMDNER